MAVGGKNPWVLRLRPPSSTVPTVRVIAFPHAGGGATSFRLLAQALPPSIELLAAQLPGREARLIERPLIGVRTIADAAITGLDGLLRGVPLVLFGHSMGSLIAYEVARTLARRGQPARLLVASAHRAPHLSSTQQPIHDYPEAELLATVRGYGGLSDEVLRSQDLIDLVLPSLRADFQTDHAYLRDPSLGEPDCPILAIAGEHDHTVTTPEILAWRACSSGNFEYVTVAGDHFPHVARAGTKAIAEVLVRALDAAS